MTTISIMGWIHNIRNQVSTLALLALLGLSLISSTALGGDIDDTFLPQVNDDVLAFAVQNDGKIIIGGSFTEANEKVRNKIARLNPDGSLDQSFAPQLGTSAVRDILVMDDGRIVIAGNFTSVNSQQKLRLARLSQDGALDESFSFDLDGEALSIATDDEGNLFVGGRFTTVGSNNIKKLFKITPDDEIDTSFQHEINGDVLEVQPLEDGKILVGGGFREIGLDIRQGLARLNSNGSLDTSFNARVVGNVFDILFIDDQNLIISGFIRSVADQTRNFIAKLNSDGLLDQDFDPNADNSVYMTRQLSDGKLLMVGSFTRIFGRDREGIVRATSTGSFDSSFQTRVEGTVRATAIQTDGKILIGGRIRSVDNVAQFDIARLQPEHADLSSVSELLSPVVFSVYGSNKRSEFAISTNVCCGTSPIVTSLETMGKTATSTLESCIADLQPSNFRRVTAGAKSVFTEVDAGNCGEVNFDFEFDFQPGQKYLFELIFDQNSVLLIPTESPITSNSSQIKK